jgi:hemoglobin
MNTEVTTSPYASLGGEAGVRKLVHRFYTLMDELPEAYTLRQMHPENLSGSEESLFEFLSGWFGGPSLYIAKKGHPRLRMRHAPYDIGTTARNQWMLCMTQAITEQVTEMEFRTWLIGTFAQMADHMINAQDTE